MYTKNKADLSRRYDAIKEGKCTKEEFIQAVQNLIGEEIERKDLPKDKYEIEEE